MEKLKEKISYLKLWLTTALAFLAGCMSWLFNHIDTSNRIILNIDAVTIVVLLCIIQYLGYELYRIIKYMKE